MPFVFSRGSLFVLLTVVVAATASCGRERAHADASVLDDFGARVHDGTAHTPARIVSLNPTTTELLFALGAGSRLVGRTHWDVWPDSARFVPDVGDGIRPNIEAVLARHPQLVVLYASADNRPAAQRLRAAGVEVLALKTDGITDFVRATHLLGIATGERAAAATIADTVQRSLDRVRRETATLERPRVVWPVWESPLMVIGGGSYLTQLLEIAGARNIYADISAPSPQVSLEDVIRRAPDAVLVSPEGAARIRTDPAWQAVPAVQHGRVLVIDTSLVLRPSVRLGEAARSLARLLHPGRIP
ncbi:MAG TPA: helical backbone metal receptor [Gemmatimonadaceae bacterium]